MGEDKEKVAHLIIFDLGRAVVKSIPISEWGQPDGSIAKLLLKQNPVFLLFLAATAD